MPAPGTHLALARFAPVAVLRRSAFGAFRASALGLDSSSGAIDMTLRKDLVSFLLRERGRWELAPAYDVTHAYNPKGEWTYQHLMSVNGKFAGISRDDLMIVADRFGVGTATKVLTEVGAAIASWPDFAKRAKVSQSETARVKEHHVLFSR